MLHAAFVIITRSGRLYASMHSHDYQREISLRRFGEGSFPYTLLTGNVLDSELSRLSNAQFIGTTHCVSFQPNGIPDNWNQDRYVVQEMPLENGSIWKLRAIFDGEKVTYGDLDPSV